MSRAERWEAIEEYGHAKGADWVLALKGNQGHVHGTVVDFFETAHKDKFEDVPSD